MKYRAIKSLGALEYLMKVYADKELQKRVRNHLRVLNEYLTGGVVCPSCHKRYTDDMNTDFINSNNECINCEHLRGDLK